MATMYHNKNTIYLNDVFFHFDQNKKMQEVCKSRFHQASRQSLCYVSESKDSRLGRENKEISYYALQPNEKSVKSASSYREKQRTLHPIIEKIIERS